MWQDALAASVAPHVPICWNDVAFVPPSAMELMVMVDELVLVSVTTVASLVAPTTVFGNAMEVGVNVTVGVEPPPVPVSVADCGEAGALSVNVSDAVNVPVAFGANSTEMVQLAPMASEVPQLLPESS